MAETARMRGLLAELGRLGAEEAEAPTRKERVVAAYQAGRAIWNKNIWMSAGFVADKCAAVLAVCGDRLDATEQGNIAETTWHRMEMESVKRKMVRMEKALRLAHRVANEMSKRNDNEHRNQVYRQGRSVRFVAWLASFIPIREAVQRLFPKHVIKDTDKLSAEMQKMTAKGGEYAADALAVALAAYVDAMQRYKSDQSDWLNGDYSKQEAEQDFEELATVADRLEAVWAVRGNQLDGIVDVKIKIQRWAKALRNAETSSIQQAGQINTVRLVVWVGESIYQDLVALVKRWFSKYYSHWSLDMMVDSMAKSANALHVALAKFFRARARYKERHEGDFMRAFDESETRLAQIGVAKLDAESAAEEVSQFIFRRHKTGSTWSVCASGPFRQRIHDSFNLIGQMLILTVCVDISAERQKQYKNLFENCQNAFYVWYDGSDDKSYAPAVQAFQALRGIIETSEGRLSAFELQTVKLLETDIDEIVSKIK